MLSAEHEALIAAMPAKARPQIRRGLEGKNPDEFVEQVLAGLLAEQSRRENAAEMEKALAALS